MGIVYIYFVALNSDKHIYVNASAAEDSKGMILSREQQATVDGRAAFQLESTISNPTSRHADVNDLPGQECASVLSRQRWH